MSDEYLTVDDLVKAFTKLSDEGHGAAVVSMNGQEYWFRKGDLRHNEDYGGIDIEVTAGG